MVEACSSALTTIAAEPVSPADDPLAGQLLWGELPLTLASLLPELGDCRGSAELPAGRRSMPAFAELLDGEGLPHRQVLPLLGPLLACWTRCRALGTARLQAAVGAKRREAQIARPVQYALRLCHAEGTPVFADPEHPRWKRMASSSPAVRLADDRQTADSIAC